jgi:hypothetical protein
MRQRMRIFLSQGCGTYRVHHNTIANQAQV